MKQALKTIARTVKPAAVKLAQVEAALAARWSSSAHKRLMTAQWRLPPQPEHFDHHIDLHHQWTKTRNPTWVERGVFSSFYLKGGDVLELACGDGFNARNFYSLRSRKVVACDFDPVALKTARSKNRAPNVEYVLCDIRNGLPAGSFQNVIWDGAIEHFTDDETAKILSSIKSRLTPDGVLTGYTIAALPNGKSLQHHEREFAGADALSAELLKWFRWVEVKTTVYPDRTNLYFAASDLGRG